MSFIPTLLISPMKMKMTDVPAPYASMARAIVLCFTNFSTLSSSSSRKISPWPKSIVFGLDNVVAKQYEFAAVKKAQANSPGIMSLKNPKLGLFSISHRRTINQSVIKQPMIKNRPWKWSGSITRQVASQSIPASPLYHSSSK